MRCHVPGLALYSAKFCRRSSGPRPATAGSASLSACRIPNENDESVSLRYQLYPRLTEISRVQKKLCGGGKTVSDPPEASTASRRLAATTVAGFLLIAASSRFSCHLLVMSRHA